MSARKMVRNLRDNGTLDAKPPPPQWRSTAVLLMLALLGGAAIFLGASYGLPGLMKAMEKKPPPVSFAKPDVPPGLI